MMARCAQRLVVSTKEAEAQIPPQRARGFCIQLLTEPRMLLVCNSMHAGQESPPSIGHRPPRCPSQKGMWRHGHIAPDAKPRQCKHRPTHRLAIDLETDV